MVDEMEGRSQKDRSWVQVVLRSRDEGATNSSFEKICGNFSFSIFTLGTTSSPLWNSGDKVELHIEQGEKVVAPLTINRQWALLKKVNLVSLRVEAVLDFYMQDWSQG